MLSSTTISKIKKLVDSAPADPNGVPGMYISITNTEGDNLLTHVSGSNGSGSPEALNESNLFWMASCTKLVATIGVLQLVEQGRISLDDGEQLEGILPELAQLPIVSMDGDGVKLRSKTKRITMRMLLTHTSGLGYSFFNDTLKRWAQMFSINDFELSTERDVLYPLLFEPGEGWEYGVGIDWAGTALERVTGMTLGEYLQENVFKPLGMIDSTFTPDAEQRARIMNMSHRKSGKLYPGDHIYKKVIDGDYHMFYHSGGAGLFCNPKEYTKLLSTLLNKGTSPHTGHCILHPSTIDQMFTNQTPQFPDLGRQGIPASIPEWTNPISDFYPQEGNPPQGWGLSWFLTPHFTKGMERSFSWHRSLVWPLQLVCDRDSGVAGMCATQVLPFADAQFLTTAYEVERLVYEGMEK